MTELTLNSFLASVERRAFRMALLATRCEADALDLVQDAMMKLVQNYRSNAATEWPLLFQRILQHRIVDWHRHSNRRRRLFWWQGRSDDHEQDEDNVHLDSVHWIDSVADPVDSDPASLISRAKDIDTVLQAVEQLPIRQQQAFLLRAWEGFDVSATATAMGCSAGSVKTHYFRALSRLRQTLEASHEPN